MVVADENRWKGGPTRCGTNENSVTRVALGDQ